VASSGLAGAWAAPLLVMNAKFTYSTPTVFTQEALLFTLAGLELLEDLPSPPDQMSAASSATVQTCPRDTPEPAINNR
jgi:hypothetical protein